MTHHLLRVALCFVCLSTASVHAATLFSQTPDANLAAYRSDGSADTNGSRSADNFTLTQAATVRSVVWRGVFEDAAPFPISFDLTFYADNSGVPGAAVSTTTVNFAADELIDIGMSLLDADIYEFRAVVPDIALSPGVTYWFSPLAYTAANTEDDWFWLSSTAHDLAAWQQDVSGSGPWSATAFGPNYFILSDTAIPEPSSIALLVLGGVAMFPRRRFGLSRGGASHFCTP